MKLDWVHSDNQCVEQHLVMLFELLDKDVEDEWRQGLEAQVIGEVKLRLECYFHSSFDGCHLSTIT